MKLPPNVLGMADPVAVVDHGSSASLSIAIALVVGIVAQSLARKMKLPGLLLLLLAGVVLGPSVLGIVRPESLGSALSVLVGFAVAVILFEGGLNLSLTRIRNERRSIQLLISLGSVSTMVGGAAAAHWIMGWDWPVAWLFGSLVIVTGPTVIGPLLKRPRVKRSVATVLEAEGVLIDAIGAITAAVVLDIVRQEFSPASGSLHFLGHLAGGVAMGVAGGAAMAFLFRKRDIVPEGLENVFALSLVLALFQLANAWMPESGIAAVTVAGVVMGNAKTHIRRELQEFKEQLTVMFIGMLFILLAADVSVDQVQQLGWPGIVCVFALMLVVRPVTVLLSTFRSSLPVRERLFISWIGPRGIVAAAVASHFATELADHPVLADSALQLRALVFLVIAVTVAVSGLSGGPIARRLGLQRATNNGWVILGANELGRQLAKLIMAGGDPVALIERNQDSASAAEKEGLRVIYGNGLDERALTQAEIDTRVGVIGLSPNSEVNLLFAQKARHEGKPGRVLVSLGPGGSVTPEMVHKEAAECLFGRPHDVELWSVRLRHGHAEVEEWILTEDGTNPSLGSLRGPFLGMASRAGDRWNPLGDESQIVAGTRVAFLVHSLRLEESHETLRTSGWSPAPDDDDPSDDPAAG